MMRKFAIGIYDYNRERNTVEVVEAMTPAESIQRAVKGEIDPEPLY